MFKIPDPELQVDFFGVLEELRGEYLQDALSATVKKMDITEIDKALAHFVPKPSLATPASHGLRGELMFPVPLILAENPRLLGYYRLLYGYSQKEFYTAETGVSRFRSMEKRGTLSTRNAEALPDLCTALAGAGAVLLDGIGSRRVSQALLDDLTLLTLGSQLRGGANVKKGVAGIFKVFDAFTTSWNRRLRIRHAVGSRLRVPREGVSLSNSPPIPTSSSGKK